MATSKKEKVEEKSFEGIDNHGDFNEALLEAQGNVEHEPNPYLEVTEKFFLALSKGKSIQSMTYGDPGVRIFKFGMAEEILSYESLPADKHRDLEIKKISEAANK